ncbi:MAG: Rab family GTPase, partial [Candidatus Heimdallarchaeota archaeon]
FENEKEILYTFKIVIVGGPSVGKTCLFNRFCFNSFNFDTSMTIGLNFHSINLKIFNKNEHNFTRELYVVNSIFDFGGQERFKPLIPKFIGGANGALLVFDLTNRISLDMLDFWYNALLKYAEGSKIPKILVGSKSDLLENTPEEKSIHRDEIERIIKEKQLDGYLETSALKNYNVLEVFKGLTNFMLRNQDVPYIVL